MDSPPVPFPIMTRQTILQWNISTQLFLVVNVSSWAALKEITKIHCHVRFIVVHVYFGGSKKASATPRLDFWEHPLPGVSYNFPVVTNLQFTSVITSLDLNLPRPFTNVHEHAHIFQTSSKLIKTNCAWRRSLLSWSVGWDKTTCHCREVAVRGGSTV